ncbi:efflux RND transporter periplasmic adaptor subunit [Pseudoroseicyclus tamaricis]|uniref:efflux RND transporter periplasmic adaptor subunit n=1 Tax=Pseudoroseicyclus tamaricis TaxID=2705421 RepID=UPI001432BCAD|nr:efflux RND transporter periplasmic adaptor subunit [Pseudoroseicyclus tamaricis]
MKSYGLAFLLVLIGAVWLSTGVFVQGGQGPHDSEMTVAQLIDGEDGGPVTEMVDATGIARDVEHEGGPEDPALSIAERNAMLEEEDPEARSVRTVLYPLKQMSLDVTLRGTTRTPATRDAVAQTSDTVAEMHVTEGQRVQAGDRICTLSTGTREAAVEQAAAQVAQAEAALNQAQTDYDTNTRLRESGIASPNSGEAVASQLRLAEANLESARVAYRRAQDDLSHTELTASADGVVQRPVANVGDLIPVGGSCAQIVQLDPMRFTGSVPQAYIDRVYLGLPADIRTINGQEALGEITYVAVSADPATRSFEVEIEFPNPGGEIRDGVTAEADVSLGEVPAHLLPQSALTLDEEGRMGVQIVEDNVARFVPVEVLNDTTEGIWVGGLPAEAQVITIGQEYVTDGQVVNATLVTEG